MRSQRPRRIDWPLALSVLLLVLVGLATLYSATVGWRDAAFKRQAMWLVLSTPLAVGLAMIDPKVWSRRWVWIYALNLLLLVLVMLTAEPIKGAQRWLALPGGYQIQPSELAKVFLVITLATVLSRMGEEIKTLRGFLLSLVHLAIPMALVFKQPDLGTSLVLGAIWLAMVFVAQARAKHILATVAAGALAFIGMWHFDVLKDYQKSRVISFINPEADARQTGYHLIQSKYAIGSGQLTGQGYLQGAQKKLRYIPEQHTDFIFSVIGEELGFLGGTALLALFGFFLFRIWRIMIAAGEPIYSLMAAGLLAMFAFHIVSNMGMTMGLFPVVGIPLPFLSSGGSMMLASMLGVGLLLGLSGRGSGLRF